MTPTFAKLMGTKLGVDARLIAASLGVEVALDYVETHNPSGKLPYHCNVHQYLVAVGAYRLLHVNAPRVDKREAAELFVAGLFHDYNHSGGTESDDINIQRAVDAFIEFTPQLPPHLSEPAIIALIRSTEWPWKDEHYHRHQDVLRDADILASAEACGVYMPITGLPKELEHKIGKLLSPKEMFEGQRDFLSNIRLNTDEGRAAWQTLYPAVLEVQAEFVGAAAQVEHLKE